jgi:hypothetical protein
LDGVLAEWRFPLKRPVTYQHDFSNFTALPKLEHPLYLSLRKCVDIILNLLENTLAHRSNRAARETVRCTLPTELGALPDNPRSSPENVRARGYFEG